MQCLKASAIWIFVFAMMAVAAFNGMTLARAFGGLLQQTPQVPLMSYSASAHF